MADEQPARMHELLPHPLELGIVALDRAAGSGVAFQAQLPQPVHPDLHQRLGADRQADHQRLGQLV